MATQALRGDESPEVFTPALHEAAPLRRSARSGPSTAAAANAAEQRQARDRLLMSVALGRGSDPQW